jgi:general secretion pathway protein D
VLLITPRVVRNLGLPDAATLSGPAGSYASPGAGSTRLRSAAAVVLPMSGSAAPAAALLPPASPTAETGTAVVTISTSGEGTVGQTVSVTLRNGSGATVRGQLAFDATLLRSAAADQAERIDFELEPGGDKAFVMRVLPGSVGKSTQVQLEGLSATTATGASMPVKVDGDGNLSFVAP